METVATYKTALALTIAEKILNSLGEYLRPDSSFGQCSCPDDWRCSCSAQFEQITETDNGFLVRLDHYGAHLEVAFRPDTLIVTGLTCGGTRQGITINLAKSQITVTHQGARSSGLGSIQLILPPEWYELPLRCEDWKLEKYKTSERSWAGVSCFLRGQWGDGPTCYQEAQEIEQARQAEARYWATLSGVEYRRARAEGRI